MQKRVQKTIYERSPTLGTVMMVERTIENYSGEFNRTELWKKMPKKVMWQTFVVILNYLESINKIAIDKESKIGWIWDPEGVKKYLKNRNLSWR